MIDTQDLYIECSCLSLQENNPPHEEAVAAIGSSTEANAGDQEEQEAGMTIDAIPELVQMMTDIQAALTGPEGSPDLDQPASEAAADEGRPCSLRNTCIAP